MQWFSGSARQAGPTALPDVAAGPFQGCQLHLPHCPKSPGLPCCPPLCCPAQLQCPHLSGEATRGSAETTGSSIVSNLQGPSHQQQTGPVQSKAAAHFEHSSARHSVALFMARPSPSHLRRLFSADQRGALRLISLVRP